MIGHAASRAWSPDDTRAISRGRVLVRVRAGETPEMVPHQHDVRRRARDAATSLGGGDVDRVLRRYSPAVQITRVHRSAATIGSPGDGHLRWDDVEEETGLSRTLRIDVDDAASVLRLVEDLRALHVVESVSPWYLSDTPFDTGSTSSAPVDALYGHRMIGAREALAYEGGDSSLIVAIVDSGIALLHAELRGRYRPGIDTVDLDPRLLSRSVELIGDLNGPDHQPMDEMGHGTATASLVGGGGIRLPRGLGGACRLLPVRVLAAARNKDRGTLTAVGALPDIDAGLKLAIDLGARVLNLSFGTPETALRPDDPKPHAELVAYARRRGCVLVAASGNSGDEVRYYPSCLDGVIAVGAVGPDARPATFSTRGDHVDLCAPGVRIPAASLDGYRLQTGTSFAAPLVAATAALMAARFARNAEPLDPDLVRDTLMASARPFSGPAVQGCGTGILDAPAALRALDRAIANRNRHADASA